MITRNTLTIVLAIAMVLAAPLSARAGLAAADVSPGALAGMDLLYAVDDDQFDFNDAYTVDNSGTIAAGSFDRVAYYLELDSDWVWISMDTFNADPTMLGVPKAGSNILEAGTLVTNLNIETNSASINAALTAMGEGFTGLNGIIEFWASNYNQNGGGLYGSNDGQFDWKDGGGGTGAGHGSFQIFALNSALNSGSTMFGVTGNGGSGIGDQPTGEPDWTFGPGTGAYAVRNLEIYVGNASDGTLNSNTPVGGDWNDFFSWTTDGAPIPTAMSIVNILDGHTVTLQSGAADGLAMNLNIAATGTLEVNGMLTVAGETAITTGGALNIGSTGTLKASALSTSEVTLTTGATLNIAELTIDTPVDLDNININLDNNITIASGASLSMGATAAPYNAPNGSLDVQGSLTGTTDITVKNLVMPAAYAIESGRTLAAETGAMGDVSFGTTAIVGNATINASNAAGEITAANLSILNNTRLIKNGPGKVSFSGTSTIGTGVNIEVNAGHIDFAAAPVGVDTVQLNGGTFETSGVVAGSITHNQLYGSSFGPTGGNANFLNLSGAAYYDPSYLPRVFAGDKPNTVLEEGHSTEQLANNVIVTQKIQAAGMFPSYTNNQVTMAFSGRFFPETDGDYTFRWKNDDKGAMWMDMDDNGVFDAGEEVGTVAWDSTDTVSLETGRGYNFMYMAQDNNGGGNHTNYGLWYTTPTAGEVFVEPGAASQAGQWATGSAATHAINMPTTDFEVTANSGIVATTDTTATFGTLTLNNGIVNISGADEGVVFASTTITGATADVGFDIASNTTPGVLDLSGTGANIIKAGAADLILAASNPLNAAGASFDVQGGRLIAQGGAAFNSLGAGSPIAINGGELVLSSNAFKTAAPFDNQITSTGGTLTAGANGGAGVGPLTVTLGNASGGDLTLASGDLLARTTDSYRLHVAGNILGGTSGGNMTVGDNSLITVANTIDAATITIGENARLLVVGTVTVNELITEAGATYRGISDLTVRNTLTLNSGIDMTGSTLIVDGANVTVSNGPIEVANNLGVITPVASVDVASGGGLELNGNFLKTEKLITTGISMDMRGTGSFIATGDVASTPVAGPSQVELTGGTLTLGGGGISYAQVVQGNAPVVYYQFDEAAGATTAVNTGTDTSFGGAVNGTMTFETSAVSSRLGTAVDLGTDGWLSPGASLTQHLYGANTTLEYFIKTDYAGNGTTDWHITCLNGGDDSKRSGTIGAGREWFWGTLHDGKVGATGSGGITNFESNTAINDDQWHHVVMTRDGTNFKVYIDGVLDKESTTFTGATEGHYYNAIGGNQGLGEASHLNAAIDELAVYNITLSPEDVEAHFLAATASGSADAAVLPATNLLMSASTILDLDADVELGNLAVANDSPATLTFTGDSEWRLVLNSTTLSTNVTGQTPGLTIDTTPKVDLGVLNLAGTIAPVIAKEGTGQWIITQAPTSYTGDATYNVSEGMLVLGDSGLLGVGAEVNVDNTAIKLSSLAANPTTTYDETINFYGNVTILAGMADSAAAPSAVVTLPAIDDLSGQTLTLGAVEQDYTLKINSAVTADTIETTGAGTVTLDNGAVAAAVTIPSGTLTVGPTATITTPSISVTGTGSLNLGLAQSTENLLVTTSGAVNVANTLTVTNQITLGDIEVTDNVDMRITGSNLADPTGTITASGAAFAMASNKAPLPASLEAWFDASAGVTVDVSNNVTNWADQSGNGRDAVTFEGTGVLTPNEVDGTMPAVLFGENESLKVTGTKFFAHDTYLVFRSDSGTTNFGPNGGGWGSPFGPTNGDNGLRSWMFDGGTTQFWGNESPGAVSWNGEVVTPSDVFSIGQDLSNYMVLKVTVGTENNIGAIREYTLGTRSDDWSDLKFATAEVLAFSSALTPEEENDIGGYLAAKYGISTTYDGSLGAAPIDMPNMGLDLAMGGTAATITLTGKTVTLGNLTTGGITDLTIAGTSNLSVNNVTVANTAPTTINDGGAEIATTIRGGLSTAGSGGNLTTAVTFNGDLTMAAGSSTTVSGGAITAKSLTHEGGTNTIAAGSAVAVTDLTVTGGTLNAANSTLTVSKQAIIGETVVATMLGDGPAFGVSGSDVLAAQTLTLNGGVMTVEGVVIGGAAIPETGLMAHYKFDETSGTVAENASNPGTIDGAMESATGWFNDATRGQVLKFEGGDDSVQITPAAGFSEEITIGMWVSVDGAQATYGSLTHHDNWGGGSVHYQFRAGNRVDFPVNGGRGDNTYLSEYAFAGANENKWTHLVATYSSTNADGEFKYYIDGVAEPVIPTNDRSINMSGFDIGSWNGDRDFVGMMDDYVIYDVALTPEQVGDLFTATSAGFVPGDPAVSLADTTLHAASSSTVAISGAQGSPVLLGGITTDESTVLTINSAAANINLTNMTLGGGSMVLSSTATSGASDVTMTVSGTLTGGNSTADIGEMPAILPDEIDGDSGAINLTLTDTSTYEWTFVGGADTNVDVTGLITMEAGATINLNYGSGSITDGTVKLFRSYLDEFSIAGLTTDDIDLSLANINITTSAGMVLETGATLAWSDYIEDPNIGEEFIYLTLTGVSTDVVVVDQDGDADNDQDVDEADMAVLLAQFGSPHSTTRAIDDNADFNGDGYVDMADFVILRANWGAGTPAPGATDLPGTTPEPTTMSLLAIGALVALRRRRRKA